MSSGKWNAMNMTTATRMQGCRDGQESADGQRLMADG